MKVSGLRTKLAAAILAAGTALAAWAIVAPGTATGVTGAPQIAAPATGPVVVIFMENHERSSIEASADADYLKAFEAAGRSFTHYYGVSHPSLPNYLGFASGSTSGKAGTDSISAGQIGGNNLWQQLSRHSISWKVFMEGMPSACSSAVTSGRYALKHNPATPFTSVYSKPTRCANVVPYSSFSASGLPAVSFIAPDLCNDMHDCSINTGDNWLAARVPAMLAAGATVVITFDEGNTGANGGGNIYCAVDGPGIAPSTNTATFNHYSLLAGIEARNGLAKLAGAKTVAALPLS